jgi:hypothetical protein
MAAGPGIRRLSTSAVRKRWASYPGQQQQEQDNAYSRAYIKCPSVRAEAAHVKRRAFGR